jgi:hypothetical protein
VGPGTSAGPDAGGPSGSGEDAGAAGPDAERLPPDPIGATLGGGGCACASIGSTPNGGARGSGAWAALAIAAALALRRRALYSSSVR